MAIMDPATEHVHGLAEALRRYGIDVPRPPEFGSSIHLYAVWFANVGYLFQDPRLRDEVASPEVVKAGTRLYNEVRSNLALQFLPPPETPSFAQMGFWLFTLGIGASFDNWCVKSPHKTKQGMEILRDDVPEFEMDCGVSHKTTYEVDPQSPNIKKC